jgi:hypothetical protein
MRSNVAPHEEPDVVRQPEPNGLTQVARSINLFNRTPPGVNGKYVSGHDVSCTYIALLTYVVFAALFVASYISDATKSWVLDMKTSEGHFRLARTQYYHNLYGNLSPYIQAVGITSGFDLNGASIAYVWDYKYQLEKNIEQGSRFTGEKAKDGKLEDISCASIVPTAKNRVTVEEHTMGDSDKSVIPLCRGFTTETNSAPFIAFPSPYNDAYEFFLDFQQDQKDNGATGSIQLPLNYSKTVYLELTLDKHAANDWSKAGKSLTVVGESSLGKHVGCDAHGAPVIRSGGNAERCVRFVLKPIVHRISQGMDTGNFFTEFFTFIGSTLTVAVVIFGSCSRQLNICTKKRQKL